MKDFEKAEEDKEEEEEKIRVEVGFFCAFFCIRESQNAFLNWIFHLSSSLFREEHYSMRLTLVFCLSLYCCSFFSRNHGRKALRTRRVGESGVRRDAEMVWTGTFYVIFLCFVFGSILCCDVSESSFSM